MKLLCKYILLLLFLLPFGDARRCFAQLNLILNPSFEILDSCPNIGGQIDRAKYWNNMSNASGQICASTLLHTCCQNPASCGINAFSNGGTVYQFPRTGNGYCMLEDFTPPPPPRMQDLRILEVIQ